MPIKFAAKKIGWSQNDKGYVLRLLVSPDDDWEQVSLAPLGTPFGVVMVTIDQETGLNNEASPGADSPPPSPDAGELRDKSGKSRKPFHELGRAQQAGILANDPKFQFWLSTHPKLPVPAPGTPADAIRYLCGVHSRSLLDSEPLAARLWDQLVTSFEQASGRMAEAR